MVTVHPASDFEDFHKSICTNYEPGDLYRGVSKSSYHLLPKIGRLRKDLPDDEFFRKEWAMFDQFRLEAYPRCGKRPSELNPWEWLSLAQHHGLATRLLDWSYNPMVALYFAVEKHPGDDGLVYVFRRALVVRIDVEADPFKVRQVMTYSPAHITHRLAAQRGAFTIHPNPRTAFESEDIVAISIPKEQKTNLRYMLSMYGIDRGSLFSELDGLARHMNWNYFEGESDEVQAIPAKDIPSDTKENHVRETL